MKTILAPALATLLFLSTAASDQQKEEPKAPALSVAVVDGNYLTENAKAMKAAREEADKIGRRFQNEFENERKKIASDADQLEKDRVKITGQEYDRRRRELERRFAETQRTAQIRQQQMAISVRQVQVKFRDEVVAIVKAMAVEGGFNLILDRGAVLHVIPAYDITKMVQERLDKNVPTIKFEFPPKVEAPEGNPGANPPPPKPGQPPKK
jgi:Skp family chaperone for outer membrane proteins